MSKPLFSSRVPHALLTLQVALQFNLSLVNHMTPLKSQQISAREGAVFSKNGQCWGCQRFFKLSDIMEEPG